VQGTKPKQKTKKLNVKKRQVRVEVGGKGQKDTTPSPVDVGKKKERQSYGEIGARGKRQAG